MSTNAPNKRRRGAVAREEALAAARDLLLSGGPSAVTLKAVGERMGVGHANLIHHFGSAAGLQGALMDRMVRDLAERIEAGLKDGADALDPGRLMTAVFDAFGRGGASQMAAWLILAREQGGPKASPRWCATWPTVWPPWPPMTHGRPNARGPWWSRPPIWPSPTVWPGRCCGPCWMRRTTWAAIWP